MEISPDNFYKLGYNISEINPEIADRLLLEARSLNFQSESGNYGTDNLSSVSPEFEHTPEITTITTPFIEEFWSDFQKNFHFLTNHLGPFTHRRVMTHRYNKKDGMNWHHDIFDGTVALNILYLTKDRFEPWAGDGGRLLVGRGEVDARGVPQQIEMVGGQSIVGGYDSITPKHGVVVTINNMNPTILHMVEPLNCRKERITMSCQFGYIEHIRRLKGMSHV